MKAVYLDKKGRVRRWFTPARAAAIASVCLLLVFLPVWRDTVQARFVLEPARRAVLRADVPGRVTELGIKEGQYVHRGELIAHLRNLRIESDLAQAKSELAVAADRAVEAELKYTGYGAALKEKQERGQVLDTLNSQAAKLDIAAPINGIVVSPRPENLNSSYVEAGTLIAEIADTSTMHARLYIPEFAMKDVRVGESASVHVDGSFLRYPGYVTTIAPAFSQLEPGLVETSQYEGIRAPRYFVADVAVHNPGTLRDGQVGEAKILVAHRSAAALAWRTGKEFLQRRIW